MYLDPVPGKQTNSKGMRYFGPKVCLTDKCVFTVRTLLFVSVLQYSEGITQFFDAEKKNDCVNRAGFKVDVMLTSITHVLIVQSF